MKKTLTVNLNNIVFHIDDDAYEMLQTYLSEISEHFKSEDERKEIMNDIEARIAELFSEKLQKNKNVINITDVEEIIEILGKPNQFAEEEEEEETKKASKDKKQSKARRFYRDPENAVLGGIAGGLASYIGWDVTLIRILLVLLVFLGVGFIIPIYIVVWFVAPQAVTAAQRLEMQGEDVTIENIKSEVNNVRSFVESDRFKQTANSFGEKILDILRIVFKVVFGFIGGILGFVGIVLVFALVMVLFFLIFEPSILNICTPDLFTNWNLLSPEKIVLLSISLLLIIGAPIFLIVYWAIRLISRRNHQQTNHGTTLVVLILWFAGLFMFYSLKPGTLFSFNHDGHPFTFSWTDDNSTYVDQERDCQPFHAIEISGNMELSIVQDSIQQVRVSCPEEFQQKVITEVQNGVLKVYTNQIFINKPIKLHISVDSIQSIQAKGACTVKTTAPLKSKNLNIELWGASTADMNLDIQELLNVDIKGASTMKLYGTSTSLKLSCLGASETEAKNLITKNADVNASGASHLHLFVTQRLKAEANGASQIDCDGSPKQVSKTATIGSSIDVK